MGKRLYCDIEIRGVVYPTAQAAAEALGVQDQTVRVAVRSGRLATLGSGASHPVPMPVRIRGKIYTSARAAARAHGVRPERVWNALCRGEQDRIGLAPNGKAKPVRIGPLSFASHADADRALGFKVGYVSHARKTGRASALQRILAAAMRLAAERERENRT